MSERVLWLLRALCCLALVCSVVLLVSWRSSAKRIGLIADSYVRISDRGERSESVGEAIGSSIQP